jgi:hypothetical protein
MHQRGEETVEIGMWQNSTGQCVSVRTACPSWAFDECIAMIRVACLASAVAQEVRTDFGARLRMIGRVEAEAAGENPDALVGVVIDSPRANR